MTRHSPRLLFDTDAFCKLGIANLLSETTDGFGVMLVECGRLPALSYMLKRGGLRRKLGALVCDLLVNLAEQMPVAPEPSERWLEPLANRPLIDPGEALLLVSQRIMDAF